MLLEKHLKALQSKLEKNLPNYSPVINLTKDSQGIMHAEHSQCLQGEAPKEASRPYGIKDIVTLNQEGTLCLNCRDELRAAGCSLLNLNMHLDEFIYLENIVTADLNPENMFDRYLTLKGYAKITSDYALANKPFATEFKDWVAGILARAHDLFERLQEDIPGTLSNDIIMGIFNRVFAVPAAWARFSSEAQDAAQEGLKRAAFELSQDQRLFVVKTDLFSESALGYHPILSLSSGNHTPGLNPSDREMLALIAELSPVVGPDLRLVSGPVAFFALFRQPLERHETLAAVVEPEDTYEVLMAAVRLHQDGGLYESLTEALKAAREI